MKRCPYCDEKIQNNAKKCKHCWERIKESDIIDVDEKEKKPNIVIRVSRFILFIISCIIFSYLTFLFVWLLLLLFSQLDIVRLIVWIIFFSGFFIWIRWFLIAWLTYLLSQMFRLPVNKKLWRIFFRIIYILACIDKISGLRIYQVQYSNTFRAIFTIIIIILCIWFMLELENFTEDDF